MKTPPQNVVKVKAWAVRREMYIMGWHIQPITGNLAVFESEHTAKLAIEYNLKLEKGTYTRETRYKVHPVTITYSIPTPPIKHKRK